MTDATPSLVLTVRGLTMHFPTPAGVVQAVDGVDLDLAEGETLGLVGESGCGKSTLGRALVRLYRPTAGSIRLRVGGELRELANLDERAMRPLRKSIQMVFQDPYASLNPRFTVRDLIAEPLRAHLALGRAELVEKVDALMESCGLDPRFAARYPHEFSGGQRQRIGIARALALDPAVVICDEPVSALDVSIRAQIMNLLVDLQRDRGLAYLFIAHDLAAVRHISARVGVMYLGRLVEVAPADALFTDPRHPYTRALIRAVPIPDPVKERARPKDLLVGEVPSPLRPPAGCRFHTRCPHAMDRCKVESPPMVEVAPGHASACFLSE